MAELATLLFSCYAFGAIVTHFPVRRRAMSMTGDRCRA